MPTPSGTPSGKEGKEPELREVARACLEAALRAVEPGRLVSDHLAASPLPQVTGGLYLVGVGKAAEAMAEGAQRVLGDLIRGGVLILPPASAPSGPPQPQEDPPFPVLLDTLQGLHAFRGGHPIPDAGSVEGSQAVLELASQCSHEDLLLCLISGGGSALMTLPPRGVSLEAVQQTTDLLLQSGATIQELNCVRKHLDRLKGGRLARAGAPAQVVALVLSDVVGDPPEVIASGPVSPDPTTFADAISVLEARDVWEAVPSSVQRHLLRGKEGMEEESPKEGDPGLGRVDWRLVGNNGMAVDAAREAAEALGFHTRILSTRLTGEAREVGRVLAAAGQEMRRSGEPVPLPGCLLAAGETTVSVVGSGRGGRNQELALGAALALEGEEGILVASLGTDGVDGPTNAAGAVVDGSTLSRARKRGLDPRDALARNDSHPLFASLGDLLLTGPTGTNVMDLHLVLVRGPGEGGE
ncbi:MAG: glycerate kinase [Gemmatimonadales bacterium]|nr:MAG: glycerate kinase [Gemmatimonadales bacterium]